MASMLSDPWALYLFACVFAAAFLFIQMVRAVVRELKGINSALTIMAGQLTVGHTMNRIVDEVQDTRLKLTSVVASIDRIGTKIEDQTALQRRKPNGRPEIR